MLRVKKLSLSMKGVPQTLYRPPVVQGLFVAEESPNGRTLDPTHFLTGPILQYCIDKTTYKLVRPKMMMIIKCFI